MNSRRSPVGFYGKLPSRGDFVRRRVPDAFVRVWDQWLQECIAASRWALGPRWLDVYLTSPAWRFACGAGACGPAPIVGVMVPSVDRVGRYFPLTVAAEMPHAVSPITAASGGGPFFEQAERLAIEMVASEQMDFDDFDERVTDLGCELARIADGPRVVLEPAAGAILEGRETAVAWQIPVASSSQLAPAFEQLLAHRLSSLYDPLVLWWTEGSSIIEPSCLVGKGLPHPDTFAALMDGSWAEREWRHVAAHVETTPRIDTLIEEVTAPRFRSAAATHVGCVRSVNQDTYLERPDVGVWAVADGLGGHSHGEVASRMVCDALADFVPAAGIAETIDAARRRLGDVNEHLVRSARCSPEAAPSGSTVVALLARGPRSAIVWAGDSRVYRWRSGRLEQLTRDHSLAAIAGAAGGEDSHTVTRAVGGEPGLRLDVHVDYVRVGDRFLLCSDGLSRIVPDADILAWIQQDDIGGAVNGLLEAALAAGAPDNVTAVIVEALSGSAAAADC